MTSPRLELDSASSNLGHLGGMARWQNHNSPSQQSSPPAEAKDSDRDPRSLERHSEYGYR